jgi:endonuclease/exonuclease/phosphatase family metal-dependent hydrolase
MMRASESANSRLPSTTGYSSGRLRVATYNIHKGVRGMGPRKRLEIHNLGLGVEALDADLVFLQEVRLYHHREARRFDRTWFGWPDQGQADFLAPDGYEVAYRTNAFTRNGEHGNALLSRWPLGDVAHHDVSDHRFEQRGLLYVPVRWHDTTVHAVVAHFGLMHVGRVRQVERLARFIDGAVPRGEPLLVAGDFNDWGERLDEPMQQIGLQRAAMAGGRVRHRPTFPSRVPVFALDRVYMRGFDVKTIEVPRGVAWARMSDHLPLVVELEIV